jgi:Transglycosylase SLT domain
MPKNHRRISQRRLTKTQTPLRSCHSKRKGKLWSTWYVLSLFCLGTLGVYGYVRVRASVLELRVSRAQAISKQVLRRTTHIPPTAIDRYSAAIAKNSVEKELNPAVVAAIVVVESGGNPLKVSPAGDLGLMQVNVHIHSGSFDFAKRNLLKAEDNIEVGTTILRTMLDQHGEENAIAAYNGLLPEKQKYAQRVKAVITRAELPTDGLKVSSDFNGGLNSYSDWIAALQPYSANR